MKSSLGIQRPVKALSGNELRTREALVQRFLGYVRGYLVVLGCPANMLDDLVQDVFLSFLRARFEYRSEAQTAAFLKRTARNLFLKALRRARTPLSLTDLEQAEDAWADYEREDLGSSYLEALRACLTGVGPRQRRVLALRYGERLGRLAIAERIGLTESGVKSILLRTQKRLRDCVERRLQ